MVRDLGGLELNLSATMIDQHSQGPTFVTLSQSGFQVCKLLQRVAGKLSQRPSSVGAAHTTVATHPEFAPMANRLCWDSVWNNR